MANERVTMARNTAPNGETPKWERYFPKTVVDAILASDREGENKTVMDLVNERIQAVVGSAPENFDLTRNCSLYRKSQGSVRCLTGGSRK